MRLQYLGALSLAILGLVAPAHAASLLEKNFWLSGPNYDHVLPLCGDPSVTGDIVLRFAQTEAEFWDSTLTIQGLDHEREIALEPWGPNYIPRRFCAARVQTSDGIIRSVTYSIAEDLGKIGTTWGVEWCVSGLDRHLAYAPNCAMAGP